VTIREACRKKEKQLDLAALGLQGPPASQGPKGDQGLQGPKGDPVQPARNDGRLGVTDTKIGETVNWIPSRIDYAWGSFSYSGHIEGS
jgi:hypothetical protein